MIKDRRKTFCKKTPKTVVYWIERKVIDCCATKSLTAYTRNVPFEVFELMEKSICLSTRKPELSKPMLKIKRKIRALNVIDSIKRIGERLQ